MWRLSFRLVCAFTALATISLDAGNLIEFRPGIPVCDGDGALLPGTPGAGYAIPCVTDWNGDGKPDLLVGYQSAGKIALYLNQGSDRQPAFTNFVNLKTGSGKEILHPSNGCGAPAPWLCDFDGDGKRDLLVGAGQDGSIWLYRNTNTDAFPVLDAGNRLQAGAAPISVGLRATPYFYDWDGDGVKDLLSGSGDGYIYFFQNTNTVQAPAFAPGLKIQAGGTNLFVGIRSVVRVLDIDGDGLPDLVCSSDNGVYWCRNTGSSSHMLLNNPLPICAPNLDRGLVPIVTGDVPGARMRVEVVDWDHDGIPDLLVGNHYGNVLFFQGYDFRVRSMIQKSDTVILQWQSAPFLSYRILQGDDPAHLRVESQPLCFSEGTTTSWTNRIPRQQQFYRIEIAQ